MLMMSRRIQLNGVALSIIAHPREIRERELEGDF